jgi:hypothetical protein
MPDLNQIKQGKQGERGTSAGGLPRADRVYRARGAVQRIRAAVFHTG